MSEGLYKEETVTEETNVSEDGSQDGDTPNDVLTNKVDGDTDTTDKPEGAPETYGDFSFPEGFELDETTLEEFKELAKGSNLSQEKAQQFLDAHNKLNQTRQESETAAFSSLQKDWVDATKRDKEVGGHDFNAKLAIANKAFKKYGTDELSELFKFTGVGNNVEMVRFLYRVGKMLSEDEVVSGRGSEQQRDVARTLYPTMDK